VLKTEQGPPGCIEKAGVSLDPRHFARRLDPNVSALPLFPLFKKEISLQAVAALLP